MDAEYREYEACLCEQGAAAHTVGTSPAPSESSEGTQQDETQEEDGLSPLSSDSEEGEISPPEKSRDKTKVEVVVTTPKRYLSTPTTKPFSSPCSPSPQPPSSPSPTGGVKRKRSLVKSEQRAGSSDREQDASAVNVKDMPGKGSPKKARTTAATPRKKPAAPTCDRSSSEYQEEDESEEGETKPVTPKKAQASPRKKPSNRKTKCGDETDDGFHSGNEKVHAPSPRKKAVVWSQEEEDAIGEVFVEAHAALLPSRFRERLEAVWRERGMQAKTSQDIVSHLRKWKKAAQAFPSTVPSSK